MHGLILCFWIYRELQDAAAQHHRATAQSSRTAELDTARLRAELDQASATLRAKDAELQAIQHKLAAAESAAARAAVAPPTAAAPGILRALLVFTHQQTLSRPLY